MPYRDTKTGRFVSRASWSRSKARGGTRYKRERAKPRRARRAPAPPARGTSEYVVRLKYKKRKGGSGFTGELHLRGPAGGRRAEVNEISDRWFATGRLPKGWSAKAVDWRKGSAETQKEIEEARRKLWFVEATK